MKAGRLRNVDAIDRTVKAHAIEIFNMIYEEIVVANDNGLSIIQVSIPITFDIMGLTNADAQRKIYASVLRILSDKDYNPKIFIGIDRTIIIIDLKSLHEIISINFFNYSLLFLVLVSHLLLNL